MFARLKLLLTRKYWLYQQDANGNYHYYPNDDTRRHEAYECWCGPMDTRHNRGDGTFSDVIEHHSLDAREIVWEARR